MGWLSYAFVSAGAAALTAILAKVGFEGVPSNLGTGRTSCASARVEASPLMTLGAILTIGT
jgi:uncharacterized membrane protein